MAWMSETLLVILLVLSPFLVNCQDAARQCNDASIRRKILDRMKDAYISGMEKVSTSRVKISLSIKVNSKPQNDMLPPSLIPELKMNWYISDPNHFPYATRFPAKAYPGVTVDPMNLIPPSRRGRGTHATIKSAISFDDSNIVDNYKIDFDIDVQSPCFDIKLTLHNVGKLTVPGMGFAKLPRAPNLIEVSRRFRNETADANMQFRMKIKLTSIVNRTVLQEKTSRQMCKNAPFDPHSTQIDVSQSPQEDFTLTRDIYEVNVSCRASVNKTEFAGLFQNHVLLFDTGTGSTRFGISLTTSTEIARDSSEFPPKIYARLLNETRTPISEGTTDKTPAGDTRAYEVLVKAFPTPNVYISTPSKPELTQTQDIYTNGRSYHRVFIVLVDIANEDKGQYKILANNSQGSDQFTFNVLTV